MQGKVGGKNEMARILVVDDAEFMRLTLSSILNDANHSVVGEAENGKEAISLYKEENPDLVLMDITMPVMDGIEAIKAIMEYDNQANIIVCSAIGQQKMVVETIELGAKDFIAKPFNKNNVLDIINQVLDKY